MSMTIREYTEAMIPEVVRFNERLEACGVPTRFPTSPIAAWLPKVPGRRLFQEYYLALDGNSTVRGAYILKHQEFRLGGQTVSSADFQLPISEGIVERRYARVGVQLLLDALRKQPLLHGLGMGGNDEAITRLLRAAGWNLFSVPFFFRIIRSLPFLRNIAHLRRSALRRSVLDLSAFTGLGWVAVKALHMLRYRRVARNDSVTVETADEFSGWADELWNACKDQYGMSAVRDSATLRVLYPKEKEKFIRLKVTEDQKVIGWAVLLDTQLSDHKQFGNMRLGSIVDCFAAPADAEKVISSARMFLEERGVDLIVSNQMHAAWCKALNAAGFMRGPSNFIFASSKKLTQLLKTSGVNSDQMHLNRGDGDGPINL